MSEHSFQQEYPVHALLRGLTILSELLRKAEVHMREHGLEPSILLTARLFPDMFSLTKQVQTACDTARRTISRLASAEPLSVQDTETTFDELQATIVRTAEFVEANAAAGQTGAATRQVDLKIGGNTITLPVSHYVARFALPNFYFHIATAYNIMRHNGVALGKTDYLGDLTAPLGTPERR